MEHKSYYSQHRTEILKKAKERYGRTYIPKERVPMINDKNGMWKGDEVGYGALHRWVERHKSKTKLCECCNKKPPYDLANISGEYQRDINDFEWICRSCHMNKDGRMNLIHMANSKINERQVRLVKHIKRINPKFKLKDLARDLNISINTIRDIWSGRRWKRITIDKINEEKK